MSSDQDQARLVAERVARRVQGSGKIAPAAAETNRSETNRPKGSSRDELSAIRAGLLDLESKLDRIESKLAENTPSVSEIPRARVINFVSPGVPVSSTPSLSAPATAPASPSPTESAAPVTRSPWSRDFAIDHPSQERFGVEEAAVSELVEFFENEKKCTVEPGGKPCDHCAMCSSRGF